MKRFQKYLHFLIIIISFLNQIHAQTFNCDGGDRLYFFRRDTTGGSPNGVLAYIENYTTSTPVITDMCTLPTLEHNALGANPKDGYLYYLATGNKLVRLTANCDTSTVCTLAAGSVSGCFDATGKYWTTVANGIIAIEISTCNVVKGPFPISGSVGLDIVFNPFDCYLYFGNQRMDTSGVIDISYTPNNDLTWGGTAMGNYGNIYGIQFSLFRVNLAADTVTTIVFGSRGSTGGGRADAASFICITSSFTASSISGCDTLGVNFTDMSQGPIYSRYWQFGDPASGISNTSSLQNPSHLYTTPGTYTVMLAVAINHNNCSVTNDTSRLQIHVYPLPFVSSYTITDISCNGGNDGFINVIPGGGKPSYTCSWPSLSGTGNAVSNLSAGNYTVTITDANGCSADTVFVITQPTLIILQTDSTPTICSGNTGTASVQANGGKPGYTYLWSNNDITSTAFNLGAGIYTVTVTDANGCIQTQTVTVTQQNNNLILTVSSTDAGCTVNNGTANATVSGGNSPYSYIWSTGAIGSILTDLIANTSYSVLITDINGCTQAQTIMTGITPNPTAIAGTSATIVYPQEANLIASGGSTYLWSPAEGLRCTSCQNTIAVPSVTTIYCVTVTDNNGCTDTACVTITVEILCGDIFIPNVFSPNSDMENDSLCIYGSNCIETILFTIYNRWGERVFETTDPKVCWGGIYSSASIARGHRQEMNAAVYVYYLNAALVNKKIITKSGNITLIK